jgi:hypothetical protein
MQRHFTHSIRMHFTKTVINWSRHYGIIGRQLPGEKMLPYVIHAKVSERQRIAVECVAYCNDLSISAATRRIMDAGIAALGIEAVKC